MARHPYANIMRTNRPAAVCHVVLVFVLFPRSLAELHLHAARTRRNPQWQISNARAVFKDLPAFPLFVGSGESPPCDRGRERESESVRFREANKPKG